MAAPDLTKRYTVFVQKQGTDDAGANAVGAPQSRLTIAAALADLAANYPAADSVSTFHIVALGPGNWAEDVVVPPGTLLNGSCDGEGQPTSIITVVSAGITLSSGWSANATAIGGLSNITIRKNAGTPALDFTLPVPVAGNPSRTLIQENVRHNLASELLEATSTADVFRKTTCVQDGANTDTFLQTGGTSAIDDVTSAAAIMIKDKTSFAAAGVWKGITTGAGAGITAQSVAAAGCTLRMTASQPRTLLITETAPGVIAVSLDAVSLPINASVTYGGTAASTDLTLLDDAYGVGYTPATPGNWSPVPGTVQAALDQLGAAAGGGTGTFAYIVRTGNRSSAAWGTAGCAINDVANTFTDTTSAGVVATAVAVSFGVPTFAASAATTYTDAAAVYIGGDVAAGANVTITNTWGLWNAGKTRVDGGIYFGGTTPASITGAAGAMTIAAAGTNQTITVSPSGTGSLLLLGNATGDPIFSTRNNGVGGIATFQFLDNTGSAYGGIIANANSGEIRYTARGGGYYPSFYAGGVERFRLNPTTGNILIGITTDGTGAMQFAAGTTSASGVTFGTDFNFYRTAANSAAIDAPAATTLSWRTAGTNRGYIQFDGTNFAISARSGPLTLLSNDTTAATFSVSQDLVLAGSLATVAPTGGAGVWKLGKYTAGVLVQAGSVLVNIDGTDRVLLTA